MSEGILSRDQNFIPVIGGVSSLDDKTVRSFQYDPVTRGLIVHVVGNDTTIFTTHLTTAVTLTTALTAYKLPTSEQASRELLVINNTSNYDVYIGGSAVTIATGILLIPGATMSIASTSGVYAVSATDGVIVRVLECK